MGIFLESRDSASHVRYSPEPHPRESVPPDWESTSVPPDAQPMVLQMGSVPPAVSVAGSRRVPPTAVM